MQNLIRVAILLLGFGLLNCGNPKGDAPIDPADCGLKQSVPVYARPVFVDTTYHFTTNNPTDRKIKMILARKNKKGKLEAIMCILVKPNECKQLDYAPVENETVYVTYRYKDWADAFYWSIKDVTWGDVDDCSPTGMIPKTVRSGIRGSTGGSGSTTTTIDEN